MSVKLINKNIRWRKEYIRRQERAIDAIKVGKYYYERRMYSMGLAFATSRKPRTPMRESDRILMSLLAKEQKEVADGLTRLKDKKRKLRKPRKTSREMYYVR